MALVACKECGKEISKKAVSCPHCGYKPRRTSLFTWLVTIFIAGPLLIGILLSATGYEPSGSRSSAVAKSPEEVAAEQQRRLDDERRSYAVIFAEKAIKERLRAPRTAKFSGILDTRVGRLANGGENDWVVQGYVDSQNGFGAMIRSDYQVVVQFVDGRSDQYRIVRADIFER